MADNIGTTADGAFKVISSAPSVNKKQIGLAVVPIPYPVKTDLGTSSGTSSDVKFNGKAVYTEASKCPEVKGNNPDKI